MCLFAFSAAVLPLRAEPIPPAPPLSETPFQGLTPPAWEVQLEEPKPVVERGGPGFYGQAEYLVWTPRVRLLDYAAAGSANGTLSDRPASLKFLDNAGFRTGIGYDFASGWDAGALFTFVGSAAHGSADVSGGRGLFPTAFGQTASYPPTNAAYSSARFHYGALDLEGGKTCAIEDDWQFRFSGGVRFAELWQSQHSSFFDGPPTAGSNAVSDRFRGVGPTAAGELRGALSTHWSLYGRVGGGLLLGDNLSTLGGTAGAAAIPGAFLRERNYRVVPVLDLGLGVRCEYRGFTARIGYEFTNYFDVFERAQFTGDPASNRYYLRSGDLSLGGLGLRFGFGF